MKFLRINKLLKLLGLCLVLSFSCDDINYEPKLWIERYSSYLKRCSGKI